MIQFFLRRISNKNIFFKSYFDRLVTYNGETYRITEVCFDDESNYESLNIYVSNVDSECYSLGANSIMDPTGTREMKTVSYGVEIYYEFPPEEQKEFYNQQPSTQGGGSIDDSTIKACYDDAIEQFKDWFLTNYSSSLADYACYSRQGDYKVQQSSSSVTITFDMSARDIADPTGPIFTVVANYSVDNGKVSRFSFNCGVSY